MKSDDKVMCFFSWSTESARGSSLSSSLSSILSFKTLLIGIFCFKIDFDGLVVLAFLAFVVLAVLAFGVLAFLAVVVLACERSRVALSVLWCKFGNNDHAHVLDVGLLVEVKDRNAVVRSLEAHNLAVVDSGPCTRR